jgi:hypothetical protein
MLFLIRRILMVVPLAAGLYTGWNWFRTPQLSLETRHDELRFQLADQWAQQIALKVGQLPGRPAVAIASTVSDLDGIITERLRVWIARRNVQIAPDSWHIRLLNEMGLSAPTSSVNESYRRWLRTGVDYVVAAKIDEWTTHPATEAGISGSVEIRDGNTGALISKSSVAVPDNHIAVAEKTDLVDTPAHRIPPVTFDSEITARERGLYGADQSVSGLTVLQTTRAVAVSSMFSSQVIRRLVIWVVFVAAIPLAGSSTLRQILVRRSNRINGIVLSGWVVLTTTLAVVLWLPWFSMNSAVLLGFVAVTTATGYFGYYCHCLEKSL